MTERIAARATGLWAPLEHREFRRLWAGFIVSHVGDSVQLHAQAWLVTELTQSGLMVGLVTLAQALPRLFFGLFAGVIVDRVDRRRLVLVTQTLAMVQAIVFAALVATHHVTYGRIVVLAVGLGAVDTLNLNARLAMMPALVPPALIGRAVALQALGVNIVQIAGPATTALLIGLAGVTGCFVVNALTFVVLLATLFGATIPSGHGTGEGNMGRELREGLTFVRARPLLWGSITLAYLLGFFGVSLVRLLALFARVVLHTDGPRYAMLAVATGLGAIAASVTVTARAEARHLPRNIVGAAALFSVSIGAVALCRIYLAAFVALVALGFGQMAFRSAITTSIQLETPDRLRGRVVSLLTLDFSLWSLGAVVAGAIADRLTHWHVTSHGLPVAAHSLAWGLSRTLAVFSLVCVLTTALLARTIVRSRLSSANVLVHHPSRREP